MARRIGMEVSIAVAEAAGLADVDVVAAYPITPQTHIVEHLAEMVAGGRLDAEFVPVESEHSAMSVCIGSSAAGARTFTSTSSQGLALMNEVVFIAASLRLPIVMAAVNRSLSGPLSIWNDHSDAMSVRDCGWIQIFVENGQEAFDHVLIGFRIGEDRRVLMPVMIHMDGFILSHMIEPVEMVSEELVREYLPPFQPIHRLHPDQPVTMGAFAMPELFTEAKKAQDEALKGAMPVIHQGWEEWARLTGRSYRPVETYRTEGAEVLLLTMGALGETATEAVDRMREKGQAVGAVKLRLWRPFPFGSFREAVSGARLLVVFDRAISFGGPGGPVSAEVRAALYGEPRRPKVVNFIGGLAGRDVSPEDFEKMVDLARSKAEEDRQEAYEIYGVRA
ncbi:MAG: transketolase C-terminal domain-containing protein [Thermodesulfobacteriota bacterium]